MHGTTLSEHAKSQGRVIGGDKSWYRHGIANMEQFQSRVERSAGRTICSSPHTHTIWMSEQCKDRLRLGPEVFLFYVKFCGCKQSRTCCQNTTETSVCVAVWVNMWPQHVEVCNKTAVMSNNHRPALLGCYCEVLFWSSVTTNPAAY